MKLQPIKQAGALGYPTDEQSLLLKEAQTRRYVLQTSLLSLVASFVAIAALTATSGPVANLMGHTRCVPTHRYRERAFEPPPDLAPWNSCQGADDDEFVESWMGVKH